MYINFYLILARIIKQIIVIKKIYPMININPDIQNIQKIIIIVNIPPQILNHIGDANMMVMAIGEKIENHLIMGTGSPIITNVDIDMTHPNL